VTRRALALALALLVALLAGCGRGRARGPVAPLTPERRLKLIQRLRPTKRVTLTPEGARTHADFVRFFGPCSLFVGYMPKGWIAATPQGCRRLVIRPVVAGKALATAAVVAEMAPATMDSAEASDRAVVENIVAWQWRAERREPWTLREADFARWVGLKHTVGAMYLGRHGGHYFWVYAYYPLENMDVIRPRFHALLDTWLWTDTGEPLNPHKARPASGRKLPGD
jgi:hypothetical protein